ncbi:FAD-dependent oxidoreductase [Cesiribacter sp. SM1]|uniref:hydroxysqualene dehydroxylase n=1 Tax=Cesiribacter sp. SM1 TaxID=2861196 RepID=UPI001CD39B3E|nr:FAD-dependent oxidoreductase [Cesiribacter sp. SM1]
MEQKHVIILGGGVAGMSAAHELIERGYKVTVFERQEKLPGGKARSVPVPGTGTAATPPLPGEHGFRFFPGFYRHLFDTLRRIPFYNETTGAYQAAGVFDNLVECPQVMLARMQGESISTPTHFPRTLAELRQIIHNLKHIDTGLKPGEGRVIAEKVWQLFTSCRQRRENEYESLGWRVFADAHLYSEAYNNLFVDGLTGALVAGKAELANTRTNGGILIQMLLDFIRPFRTSDRILNAPTNEAWLFPWLEYLRKQGVVYHFGHTVETLLCDRERIRGVVVTDGEQVRQEHRADYYICALPVERAARLVSSPGLLALDPNLENILKLKDAVAWMNGLQFYLKRDVPISSGHIILPDTPWALTAISQAQFWKGIDLSTYGKGNVKGVLSVIISNWTKEGILVGKKAESCSKEEVVQEVWAQLKACFNRPGRSVLFDDDFASVYVADSIYFTEEEFRKGFVDSPNRSGPARYGSSTQTRNDEPLLVNEKNSWGIRNESYTAIPNLFLASDYIRTNTNLATMEGANEAARRAVNNILDASGVQVPYCRVWKLKEPRWLGWYKWLDRRRYEQGLPWKLHKPWFTGLLARLLRAMGITLFN